MCVSVSVCVCECVYVCVCVFIFFVNVCVYVCGLKFFMLEKSVYCENFIFLKCSSVQNILWSKIFFSRKNVLVEKNCFLQKSFSSKFLLKCFV